MNQQLLLAIIIYWADLQEHAGHWYFYDHCCYFVLEDPLDGPVVLLGVCTKSMWIPASSPEISHSRKNCWFSGHFSLFKGCASLCLVFSAVLLDSSLPSPAMGGWSLGGGGIKGRFLEGGWVSLFDLSQTPKPVRIAYNWTHIYHLLVVQNSDQQALLFGWSR